MNSLPTQAGDFHLDAQIKLSGEETESDACLTSSSATSPASVRHNDRRSRRRPDATRPYRSAAPDGSISSWNLWSTVAVGVCRVEPRGR
ncbi:hypothetical protein VTN00DRAFT_9436 [Thermoascus crustaceus]|uniref:uncharacterized protein n=1 Tax=Thermoascus crustaceus TaxID=5088 RepID=UPI00374249E4